MAEDQIEVLDADQNPNLKEGIQKEAPDPFGSLQEESEDDGENIYIQTLEERKIPINLESLL